MIMILIKKELKQYFSSPIAYILIFFFTLMVSLWTFQFQAFFANNVANFRVIFNVIPIFFIVLVPAVTMRTWSEEQKSGADELLLTLPFSEMQLVLGKFIAAFFLFIVMLLINLCLTLSLLPFGDFELGVLFANYLGIILLSAVEVSLGCFLSSLTKNQISNFLLATLVLFLLTLIGYLPSLPSLPRWIASFISYVSIPKHLDSFVKGLIDTRDVLYYLILSALFLFLNRQVLINRKWR